MINVLAVEAFGRDLPDLKFLLIFFVVAGAFLFFSRSSGHASNRPGGKRNAGREHQCQRCGREFHPQQTVTDPNGSQHTQYNDRCPNCGWDLDWGKPDAMGNPQN